MLINDETIELITRLLTTRDDETYSPCRVGWLTDATAGTFVANTMHCLPGNCKHTQEIRTVLRSTFIHIPRTARMAQLDILNWESFHLVQALLHEINEKFQNFCYERLLSNCAILT